MSADNFLALRFHEPSAKYMVTHESASADELSDLNAQYDRILQQDSRRLYYSGIFDTWLEASSFIDKCYEDEHGYIEYGACIIAEQPAWENMSIQFPRLLAEIVATQDNLDIDALAESMNLTVDDVHELFENAQKRWEDIKDGVTGTTDRGGCSFT